MDKNLSQHWQNILIQGLTGIGLVGFNISRAFMNKDETKKVNIIRDFSNFFPNVAIIKDGKIRTQNLVLEEAQINNNKEQEKRLLLLNGPQPQGDGLTVTFIQQFTDSLREFQQQYGNIDMYFSFGAMMKKMKQPEQLGMDKEKARKKANEILDNIEQKKRKFYLATASNLTFESFVESCNDKINPDLLIKEEEGIITGLNGVLPAYIGQALQIPVLTVMVEATIPEWASPNSPLTQFIGLHASLSGIDFLRKIIELKNGNLEDDIKDTLQQLRPMALKQLTRVISSEKWNQQKTSHDRMYV